MRKLIFTLIFGMLLIGLILISSVMASDNQTQFNCGGDEEFTILCDFGDSQNVLNNYLELGGGSGGLGGLKPPIPDNLMKTIFGISLLIIIPLIFGIYIIKKRRK